jgi:hypothetical protein
MPLVAIDEYGRRLEVDGSVQALIAYEHIGASGTFGIHSRHPGQSVSGSPGFLFFGAHGNAANNAIREPAKTGEEKGGDDRHDDGAANMPLSQAARIWRMKRAAERDLAARRAEPEKNGGSQQARRDPSS